MLTTPVPTPDLPPGWAGEPKRDGFRALLHTDEGRVALRSRRSTDITLAFPDIAAAAAQLPDATALNGELVVWEDDRLAFERLQDRLQRRGAAAARAAEGWPAHFVAFDLLRLSGTDATAWPYQRRRAALESMFTARRLTAPWTLSPSTGNPDTVREWLTWTSVGVEGLVFKRLDEPYRPAARGWRKYKVRETTEAIVGAVTGSPTDPARRCSADATTGNTCSTSAAPPPSSVPPAPHSPDSSPWRGPGTRGQGGRSPPDGVAGRLWTSPWPTLNWSWKSAPTSPATQLADGGIPHAGIAHAPISPPTTSRTARRQRDRWGPAGRRWAAAWCLRSERTPGLLAVSEGRDESVHSFPKGIREVIECLLIVRVVAVERLQNNFQVVQLLRPAPSCAIGNVPRPPPWPAHVCWARSLPVGTRWPWSVRAVSAGH
ncbi:hypothetical protein [Streptomyces sp. NPDC056785]|uniref:ATP-dependent DNA ligase n=1 Tax=Streptomyces sp. NPDC056785 TaxID=3345944 RepID=UPI0036AEF5D7